MLGVLFYEPVENVMELAPAHYPAHQAWAVERHDAGDLIMIGTFADPLGDGSMAIFTSEAAARSFAEGDPFVKNQLVKRWKVLGWAEVFTA
jgi:uncharacterized protein YciI